jgi:hypothetical protein
MRELFRNEKELAAAFRRPRAGAAKQGIRNLDARPAEEQLQQVRSPPAKRIEACPDSRHTGTGGCEERIQEPEAGVFHLRELLDQRHGIFDADASLSMEKW